LLGDLMIWMYENLAGIHSDTNDVGFKRIIMKPSFNVDLSFVNASYQSPYGPIKTYWKKENGQLNWNISIPGNTSAIVYVPAKENEVKEGTKLASLSQGIKFLKMENGKAVFEVGSGSYSFNVGDYRLTGN